MRKAEKRACANTFEAVAREWMEKNTPTWSNDYLLNIRRRLEQHVFPWIGSRPVHKLTAADVLEPLQRIEKRGKNETAHRGVCGSLIRALRRAQKTIRARCEG